jgi:hypothetical protein
MIRNLYVLYGIVVLGTLGLGEYRGWSFDSVDKLNNVPRSIRDNPGSYRSVYSSYHHYTGGK